MGVFSRLGDIVNSNINAMLDRAENPEKMIRLMIQEMEDTLVDLKSSCAAKMAAKAEMERDRKGLEAKVERWKVRAMLAVEHKRDDLAKEALLEKKQCMTQLELAEKDSRHYEQIIDECRGNITQLEQKLEEVSLKHKILIQRGIHAAEQKRVRATVSTAGGTKAMMRFDELENRIEKMEADAELTGSMSGSNLEREFEKLESDNVVEEELAALKKRMNKMAPKGTKPTEKGSQSE